MTPLEQKIESLLFFKNEPLTVSWLAKTLKEKPAKISASLDSMKSHYLNRGITLVVGGQEVALMTADVAKDLIQSLSKQESGKELSKQALETLAIISYNNGITKSEIDYIRGVNSVFILRNLAIRGLITKKPNPADKRSPLYVATIDFLNHLGINDVHDLPDFDLMSDSIQKLQDDFEKELTNEKS
jgi:segregation and condensation protein B